MAEDAARAYIFAYETARSEAQNEAVESAKKLQNGEFKLLDVIRAAGEYLQNTDTKIRERATHYLADIIEALPPKFLTRHDIPVLNTFLCSRIQDGGAVEGLTKLQSLERFTQDNAQELAQAIFDNFGDMTEKKQAERYQVYLLVNNLLIAHRSALQAMGDKSLLGFIQVVGGEKDPRNLMLIFSMIRVFMIEWDISLHIEMMFDSVYAYFPITFRPPPNDPYGITAQDLKDRLRDCLASNGQLAPSAFPNLLDRLDSTSEIVKKDVLQALVACALNYDPPTIAQYSITLWDAVKFEVLQAQEPFLADEALTVIKNIAKCLSQKSSPHAPEWKADPLIHYLKPINKECLEHLQEPASRQAGASGDIIKAVASATIRSFEIVLKGIGPALFTLQQSSEGINNQRAILTVVNKIFEASIEVYGTSLAQSIQNDEAQITLLAEFKDKLLAIYSRALMSTVKEEVSYRLVAMRGLLLLAKQRSLLDENEVGLIVQHFNEIVLDQESYGRDELKQRTMQSLAEISHFKPRLITDITFPQFIARLPDDEQQAETSSDYQAVLEGLAEISIGKDLLDTLVRRLLNKLDLLMQSPTRKEYPYTCAVLSTIYYVLNRSSQEPEVSLEEYFDRFVVGQCKAASTAQTGPLINDTILALVGKITNLIIRRSPASKQDEVADNVYRLFESTDDSAESIRPSKTLVLSTWLLAALPKSSRAGLLGGNLISLVRKLRDNADQGITEHYEPVIAQACLKQVLLIVNKHVTSASDMAEVQAMFQDAIEVVSGNSSIGTKRDWECVVRFLFSICKALLFRLAPSTDSILVALTDMLERLPRERARYFALGFNTLLSQDDIISKTNQVQIRLLAPQRVFQKVVPMISEKFKDHTATLSQREIYLIALSGVLGTVGSDIVMPELPTLLPLLLQSLEISDATQNVKTATLETMVVVITKNPEALIESGHIPALIRRLIAVATASRNSTSSSKMPPVDLTKAGTEGASIAAPAKTRQLALHCLTLLPQHIKDQKTPNPLLNLKREVLNGLLRCLDDPRRDVRKEAVDARSRWLRNIDNADDSDED